MKFKSAHTWLILILLVMSLIAWRNRGPEPEFGGRLRLGTFHKPTEINPLTTSSSIAASLLDTLFDYLIRFNNRSEVDPELAKRWELSPDGLTWTFYLRRDVRFHDGTPLTARDIKATYDYVLKKAGTIIYKNFFSHVREVRVLDPYTVEISLSHFDHALWSGLGMIGIIPQRFLANDPGFADFNRHPIGSGPYRFVKQDDKEIVLAANEDYFQGRPYLDHIIVKTLSGQGAVLNHLIAGRIDMAFLLNPEDYGALGKIPSIRIYNNWYPFLYILMLNHRNPLFTSAAARRALNEAVDKERIIQRVLHVKRGTAAGTVSPEHLDYDPQLIPYPYRPDRALKRLQQTGWRLRKRDHLLEKAGKTFEFTTYTVRGHNLSIKTLQLIQEQLREIGIKMNITVVSFNEYVREVLRNKDFDAGMVFMIFRPFYNNNFNMWHSSQIEKGLNFSSYKNPEVDRLLTEARLNLNPAQRRNAFLKFQQVLHDDPPGIFLFWRDMPIAVHRRFRGIPEKRMESLRDLVHVWVPKSEQIDVSQP